MSAQNFQLLSAFQSWMEANPTIKSVVLFGSSARVDAAQSVADGWSDFDFHVIAGDVEQLESIDWAIAFPSAGFIFKTIRPATGGVRKSTLFFERGQVDLVVLPLSRLRLARLGFFLGLYPRVRSLKVGLDEISTCIQPGYRFLKGEKQWGKFYGLIVKETTGVRLEERELCQRADVATADLLWILQKIDRGELRAAQHLLHRSLAETNFALIREYRIRIGQRLPSFGFGRRAESLLTADEIGWVSVEADLKADALRKAAWHSHAGMRAMMAQLMPQWRVPAKMEYLLSTHAHVNGVAK